MSATLAHGGASASGHASHGAPGGASGGNVVLGRMRAASAEPVNPSPRWVLPFRRRLRPATETLAWSTRTEPRDDFREAWTATLSEARHANFTMRMDHVAWEALHGRHALLLLVERNGRRGALVLREAGNAWESGWPWRWQAVVQHPEAGELPGLDAADARWLFEAAERRVRGARLRMHLPVEPPVTRPSFPSGATIVQSLVASDDDLLAAMDSNKRRLVRRATACGYTIGVAEGPAQWREFAQVQHAAMRLRQPGVPAEIDPSPAAGHGFREWSLPWMWLMLAHHEGQVVAGVGDGRGVAWMADGRAAAATPEARRSGVFALLCHREAGWLRDHGHRWLNHGGDTVFKREIAGRLGSRVALWCWLGGGGVWRVANRTESTARSARRLLAAFVRSVAVRGTGKGWAT